jgi:FkbM family methyltransferase
MDRKNYFSKTTLAIAAWAARILPVRVKNALYRSGPLARWIRGQLNRAAPQGLTEVEVAGGALAGMRLVIDLQSEKEYWLGTYEPELQAALRELNAEGHIRPGMVAYDVGANIGYITLILRQKVGETGRVFAFEPLPENVERLRRNVEMNGYGSQIEIFSGAVLDRSGPVSFLIGPSISMGKAEGSAGRSSNENGQAIEVPGISLDEFVYRDGNPPPQIVKIDIEGGEVMALPGMQRLLTEARPVVLIELHGTEAAQIAWTILEHAGYQICRMAPGFPPAGGPEALGRKAYLAAFNP